MQDVTIVKIADTSHISNVATFEEAFGDWSEARGKGRDRRAARKSDRRQKKTTKKLEKVESKDTVKRARREGKISRRGDRKVLRQTGRADRKTGKMEARQTRKTDKMGMKQGRRFDRKDMRLQRKELGAEPELEMDNQTMMETDNGYTDDQGGYTEPQDQGTYEDQGGLSEEGDSTHDESGNGYGEYETTQEGDYEEGAEEESDDYGAEDYPEDDYEDDYEDDSDIEQGDYEDESNQPFDGVMGSEDRFFEASDSEKPVIPINPGVSDVAARIEWNKQLLSRLRVRKAELEGLNKSTQAIEAKINETIDRISDLEGILKRYSNFESDFSSADGSPCPCAIKKASKGMRKQRAGEVAKAKRIAKNNRVEYNRSRAIAKKRAAIQAKSERNNGGDVTPIEVELNPLISKQRIEIPATSSSASGTGLNGLDNINDIDAPDTRVVELTSNATGPGSGPGMKVNWRAVGIGVVIAVVAIGGYVYYKKHVKNK